MRYIVIVYAFVQARQRMNEMCTILMQNQTVIL